jgi:hypothetical protein
MDFERDVQLTGRLLRLASRAGRPLLRWNHEWMMRGGLAGPGCTTGWDECTGRPLMPMSGRVPWCNGA